MTRRCFVSRDEFLVAVGTVNAELKFARGGVRYETKYALVADRVASIAKGIEATVLHTVTDDGLHVVSVKGFYRGGKR